MHVQGGASCGGVASICVRGGACYRGVWFYIMEGERPAIEGCGFFMREREELVVMLLT